MSGLSNYSFIARDEQVGIMQKCFSVADLNNMSFINSPKEFVEKCSNYFIKIVVRKYFIKIGIGR